MAKQVIGIGTTANDGTGDQVRVAFDKTNQNFTELYDAQLANSDDLTEGSVNLYNQTHTGDVTGSTSLTIADNAVNAAKLNVLGNGTSGQALLSDGDGSFSWGSAGETYTAGVGITLTGNAFSLPQNVSTISLVQFGGLGIGTAPSGTPGVIRASNDVVAYFSSDKRLKDNIKPINSALDKVCKLGGYEFDWNDKQDVYEGHDIGVIAQEVEAVFPELVTDRNNGFKAVKYEKLVPALIEAIKEQQKQINELKTRLDGITN